MHATQALSTSAGRQDDCFPQANSTHVLTSVPLKASMTYTLPSNVPSIHLPSLEKRSPEKDMGVLALSDTCSSVSQCPILNEINNAAWVPCRLKAKTLPEPCSAAWKCLNICSQNSMQATGKEGCRRHIHFCHITTEFKLKLIQPELESMQDVKLMQPWS